MATRTETWQIIAGRLQRVNTTLADAGRTEAYDLESWIVSNPAVVSGDIIIIGRQVPTESGPLDLLGIDHSGNLVVIELKRDKLPREAMAQAVDYASDVASWSLEKVGEVCAEYTSKSLEDCMAEGFPEVDIESLNINEHQRILLVGFAIDASLERMIDWLSDAYSVDINALILQYVRTASGDELVTKTSVISDEIAERRVKPRKSKIPMSDAPGEFEEAELRRLLLRYLSSGMVTAERIRDVLIPMCLRKNRVSRKELTEAFVQRGVAEDMTKAGLGLAVLSGQLGMENNSFLRQVIGYEYPNHKWEKDNYHIRAGYHKILEDVLKELDSTPRTGERAHID